MSRGLGDVYKRQAETVMRKYLTEKLFKMGYQGILGKNNSAAAGCKYFAALNPNLIKIIS